MKTWLEGWNLIMGKSVCGETTVFDLSRNEKCQKEKLKTKRNTPLGFVWNLSQTWLVLDQWDKNGKGTCAGKPVHAGAVYPVILSSPLPRPLLPVGSYSSCRHMRVRVRLAYLHCAAGLMEQVRGPRYNQSGLLCTKIPHLHYLHWGHFILSPLNWFSVNHRDCGADIIRSVFTK